MRCADMREVDENMRKRCESVLDPYERKGLEFAPLRQCGGGATRCDDGVFRCPYHAKKWREWKAEHDARGESHAND